MRKSLSIILMLGCFFVLSAQVASFKITQIKTNSKATRMDLYKNEKNEIILNPLTPSWYKYNPFYDAQENNGKLILNHYNANINFIGESDISLKDNSLLQTFSFGDKNVALLESYNKDIWTLGYAVFDGAKITPAQGKKLCDFPIGSRSNKNLAVLVSQNKEYFGLINAFEIKGAGIINVAVYDKDFNQVWIRKGINIPAKFENIGVESSTITNTGDVMVLMESYDKTRRSITQYEMAVLTINGERNDKEVVSIRGMLPMRSKISVNNNMFLISGFYYLPDRRGYQGMYAINTEIQTPDFSNIKTLKFSSEFINNFLLRPNYKGNNPLELGNVYIRNIHPTNDQGYLLVVEKFEMTIIYNNKSSTEYLYEDGSIFYVKVNKDGNFEHLNSFMKWNYSKNSGGNINSFASIATENTAYVFYNVSSKQLNLPLDNIKKNKFSSKTNNIECIEIDLQTGKNKRFMILPADQKAIWIERQVLHLGDKDFAFVARTKSKRFLCKVTLK